jgi:hypothetical protein
VLSGRGLCDELITCPEEYYRLWCVVMCDLETWRMRRPWPALGRSSTRKKCTTINVYLELNWNPEEGGDTFFRNVCMNLPSYLVWNVCMNLPSYLAWKVWRIKHEQLASWISGNLQFYILKI